MAVATSRRGVNKVIVFEDLPSTLPEPTRKEWVDDHLEEILALITGTHHNIPCRIREYEMSYSNATSCSSHINTGFHGEGWSAAWQLDPEVDPIQRPDEHPEFAHYSVFVIYDELYGGDRTGFPDRRAKKGAS
jgi:hypothetical protein